MDQETKLVVSEQKMLKDLVNSDGWKIARNRLETKILELQNAFDIEDSTPEKMLLDLSSRKIASALLFDFLRNIEGDASVADQMDSPLDEGVIVRL